MSLSIKEILKSLSESERYLLSYAFETGLSNQFIVYEEGRFIGVNMDPDFKKVTINQTAGRYSEGTIRD